MTHFEDYHKEQRHYGQGEPPAQDERAPASLLPAVLARLRTDRVPALETLSRADVEQQLRHPDWVLRAQTVRLLGNQKGLVPRDLLLLALQDPHETVRMQAVYALGQLGGQRLFADLHQALVDPSWQVREMASTVLSEQNTAPPGDAVPPGEEVQTALSTLEQPEDTTPPPGLQREAQPLFFATQAQPAPLPASSLNVRNGHQPGSRQHRQRTAYGHGKRAQQQRATGKLPPFLATRTLLTVAAVAALILFVVGNIFVISNLVYQHATNTTLSQQPRIVVPSCKQSLQQVLDRADAGVSIQLASCIYREQVRISRPVTLLGEPGTEIRGSDLWTGWQRRDNGWISTESVPPFFTHGSCAPATGDRCLHSEQVFRDGQGLTFVSTSPGSGQFSLDSERHVLLADDPAGHVLEVTTRQSWIVGEADHVTIQGVRMRYAATDAQHGAIAPQGHAYWTIRDCVLSDVHGALIDLGQRFTSVLHNELFRAGQEAIHGGDNSNTIIQGNKIYNNNTDGFDSDWEAGGVRIVNAHNLLLDANQVYQNNGKGLACTTCNTVTYTNNQVYENGGVGISFEISDGARILNNRVWRNSLAGFTVWGWGAGILLSSSSHVEVANNIVAWNPDGIAFISQNRGTQWNTIQGNYAHDNTIIMSGRDPYDQGHNQVFALAWLQDWNGILFQAASHNRGEHNAFWFPVAEKTGQIRFSWDQGYDSLQQFAATPGGKDGYYLSNAQKDQLLKQAGMPLN